MAVNINKAELRKERFKEGCLIPLYCSSIFKAAQKYFPQLFFYLSLLASLSYLQNLQMVYSYYNAFGVILYMEHVI